MNGITCVGIGLFFVVGAASAQMGAGMGGMGKGMKGHGPGPEPMGVSVVRHQAVMTNGLPKRYAQARNPLKATPANIEAGKAVFQQNCVACHGATGRGDGPAAASLNPKPSDLTVAMHTHMATDPYLDWTISEGGEPVKSAMPGFKKTVSGEKLWKLVLYLRTL